MEARDTCGQSPDTFADRSSRGLLTTPALSLLILATGEKMVLRLVGKVRVARDLFRNYSSNLPLLSFGSFANPAFISDIFPWLLLFLMAQ